MNIDASRIKRKKKITFVKFHSRFVFVYTHPSGVHSVYYRHCPACTSHTFCNHCVEELLWPLRVAIPYRSPTTPSQMVITINMLSDESLPGALNSHVTRVMMWFTVLCCCLLYLPAPDQYHRDLVSLERAYKFSLCYANNHQKSCYS